MEKNMMIDYRNDDQMICRRVMDDMEFCVRDGFAHFLSNGVKYHVPLEDVIQVYMY